VREENEKVDMSRKIKCTALILYTHLKVEGPKHSSMKY
jgi:hypothetical protein